MFAGISLVAVWIVALSIFHFSGGLKMTAEKVQQYLEATDLARLSAAQRAKALAEFADKVNALSIEERVKWRRSEGWKQWFAGMTEAERSRFIDATLPTGFKQIMEAFSQLPDEKRKKLIDDAVNRIKQSGAAGVNGSIGDYGKNGPPPLSPDLERQVRAIGLNALYTESSSETKAELAPLLEQINQQIRRGGVR